MGDEETNPGGIPRAEGGNPPRGANSPPLRNLTVPENTGPATPFQTPGELNRQVDVVPLNVNQGGHKALTPFSLQGLLICRVDITLREDLPELKMGTIQGVTGLHMLTIQTHRGTTRDRYPLGRTPIMGEMLTDLRVMKIPRMIPLQRKENLIS